MLGMIMLVLQLLIHRMTYYFLWLHEKKKRFDQINIVLVNVIQKVHKRYICNHDYYVLFLYFN